VKIDDIYCKACGEFTMVEQIEEDWYCLKCKWEVRSEFIFEKIFEKEENE
jgi:ribosomal protein L37AE/L43A